MSRMMAAREKRSDAVGLVWWDCQVVKGVWWLGVVDEVVNG